MADGADVDLKILIELSELLEFFFFIIIILFFCQCRAHISPFRVWRGSGREGIRRAEGAYLRLPRVNCLQSSASRSLFEYFQRAGSTPPPPPPLPPQMSSLAILCNFFSWRLNWGVIKWSDGISGPAGQKHQKPVGERWKRTRVRRHWGRRFGINAGTLSSLRRPLRRRHYYLDKWDNWAECRCSAGALLSAGSSAPPGVTTLRPSPLNSTLGRRDHSEPANKTNPFVHLQILLFYVEKKNTKFVCF